VSFLCVFRASADDCEKADSSAHDDVVGEHVPDAMKYNRA
jgi:hypothetical protein